MKGVDPCVFCFQVGYLYRFHSCPRRSSAGFKTNTETESVKPKLHTHKPTEQCEVGSLGLLELPHASASR